MSVRYLQRVPKTHGLYGPCFVGMLDLTHVFQAQKGRHFVLVFKRRFVRKFKVICAQTFHKTQRDNL